MKAGVPIIDPSAVIAVASRVPAIPKSITFGPSSATRTLDGFMSRCTTPCACSRASTCASRWANVVSAGPRRGPSARTSWSSVGAATYSVAIHGRAAAASPSTRRISPSPRTAPATAISRAKRLRNSGSAVNPECSSFTATLDPSSARPR